jgi:UDP-N-acetylglucosamine acyltransferase
LAPTVSPAAVSVVAQDIPPFVLVNGHPAHPRGINSEGLRRRNFKPEAIAAIKQGFRLLYKSRSGWRRPWWPCTP